MEFEYDPAKSAANAEKHGIDFEAAQAIWDDPDAIDAPALETVEPRFLVVGRMDGKHWTAVVTYRKASIRIISVRRARKKEIEGYESARVR